ncbi:WhiB family transcriptional regulator [Streptomyces sp. NPDC054855]
MYAPANQHTLGAPWVERAACRGCDPDTFFPSGRSPDDTESEAAAKRLCASCPVVADCLAEALAHEESAGIWGGLTVRERRELRRVAGTVDAISGNLHQFLESGGRRSKPRPQERSAYVWFLRRRGWGQTRIATALGMTFGQVQHAWRTAEFAAVCGCDFPATPQPTEPAPALPAEPVPALPAEHEKAS